MEKIYINSIFVIDYIYFFKHYASNVQESICCFEADICYSTEISIKEINDSIFIE